MTPAQFNELCEELASVATELRNLGFGNAFNREGIGAIEGLTMRLCDKGDEILAALADIAEAIRECKS